MTLNIHHIQNLLGQINIYITSHQEHCLVKVVKLAFWTERKPTN